MQRDWTGKWAIDTNILVYALDRESPYFDQTKSLFAQFKEQKTSLYTAQQNVLEAENVLINTYKVEVKEAVEKVKKILEAFEFSILSSLPTTLVRCHTLVSKMKSRNIFDLYLAATLMDNKIDQLVTADTGDFKGIPKFKVDSPYK